ncbi:hypothetical protein [Nannocystis sp.]|uniref:hypothetical protein n=1 Tax=Nannocystis sp. TaxID=1962667 RepID=UPI0025E73457|nr:hypothetical protein [Nannocystis sp.]MBK7825980.1 hypothetical protein [Nannocystis sp.]
MKSSTLNLLSILCGTLVFSGACDVPEGPEHTTLDTLSITALAPFTVNPAQRQRPSASNDLQPRPVSTLSMECDAYQQDCPEGQKCAPFIDDGGPAWNANKCVAVTGMDQVGHPCHTDDIASGSDSCVEGAMCWNVDMDGNGTCVAQSSGSPEAPSCEPGTSPITENDGVLNLCLPDCNPLADDCGANEVCIAWGGLDSFLCVVDAAPYDSGQAFDPCEFVNVCDPGLACVDTAIVGAGCDPGSVGCCTPFCDTSLANNCPAANQQCVPYLDPMWVALHPTPYGEDPFRETLGLCLVW